MKGEGIVDGQWKAAYCSDFQIEVFASYIFIPHVPTFRTAQMLSAFGEFLHFSTSTENHRKDNSSKTLNKRP